MITGHYRRGGAPNVAYRPIRGVLGRQLGR